MRDQLGKYDGLFVWVAPGNVSSLHFVRRGIKYPVLLHEGISYSRGGCPMEECNEDPCSLAVVVSPTKLHHFPTHEHGQVYDCHHATEVVQVTVTDEQVGERQFFGDISLNLDHRSVANQICTKFVGSDVDCVPNAASEVRRLLHRLDTPGMLARTLRREGLVLLRGAFADDLEVLKSLRTAADEWITRPKNGIRSSGTKGRLLPSAFSFDRFSPFFETFRSNKRVMKVLERLRPAASRTFMTGDSSKSNARFRVLEHYDIGVNNVCSRTNSRHANDPSSMWHRDSIKYLHNYDPWGRTVDGAPVHEIYKLLVYLQDHSEGGGLHYRSGTHARLTPVEQRPAAYDQMFPRFGDAIIMDQRLVHCAHIHPVVPDGLDRYLVAVGFGTDSPATNEFELTIIARQEKQIQELHDQGQKKGIKRLITANMRTKLKDLNQCVVDGNCVNYRLPEHTRKLMETENESN